MRRLRAICLFLALLLPLAALAETTVDVVLEDSAEIRFQRQVYTVRRGEDLTLTVYLPMGSRLGSVSYESCTVSDRMPEVNGLKQVTLTLHEVRYPVLLHFTLAPDDFFRIHTDNGVQEIRTDSPRLRINTPAYDPSLEKAGCILIGWTDTAGNPVGFGHKIDRSAADGIDLWPAWLPAAPAEDFTFIQSGGGAVITRGSFHGGDLVIPSELGGLPVIGIAAGAFGGIEAETVVLPPSLRAVEAGAFASLTAEKLILFDNLEDVSDLSFGSVRIHRLQVNAARPPVYCGSYFDTFTEKYDRLRSLRGARKLVLFAGSSARFGYDSAALDAAFPEYAVVNMGVYAYANMRPQAELVLQCLRPGDAVLLSPELDAIPEQFCGRDDFDPENFSMMESDYGLLLRLDLRGYTGIFDAFAGYQRNRRRLPKRRYSMVPSAFDEDGNPVQGMSYNVYGDYVLERPDNEEGRLFGVKRASFYPEAIREEDWDGLNRVCDAFAAAGAQVLLTFSPRSEKSITEESTPEAIAALAALFGERLHARIITPLQDALMDAKWFCGTDNHLSTAGVQLRTRKVIEALEAALEVSE